MRADDTLDFVPSWFGYRMLALGSERAARISLAGPSTTGAARRPRPRARRPRPAAVRQGDPGRDQRADDELDGRALPEQAWARLVYPDLDAGRGARAALGGGRARLPSRRARPGRGLGRAGRRARGRGRAAQRAPLRRAPLRGAGNRPDGRPAPDAPSSTARATRPSTGSCTSPTCRRRRSTPRPIPSGPRASCARRSRSSSPTGRSSAASRCGSRAAGRSRSTPSRAPRVLRGRAAFDEGAARLGEVALVDREGRIGRLGTVFYDTLLDENAASHIALGDGFDQGLSEDETARRNRERDPHRLHDRRRRRRGHRLHAGRRARAGPPRRRLAALELTRRVTRSASLSSGQSLRAAEAAAEPGQPAGERARRGALEHRHAPVPPGDEALAPVALDREPTIVRAIRSGSITVHSSAFGSTLVLREARRLGEARAGPCARGSRAAELGRRPRGRTRAARASRRRTGPTCRASDRAGDRDDVDDVGRARPPRAPAGTRAGTRPRRGS